jgi:pyrimidine-nucleoside phosphorylase
MLTAPQIIEKKCLGRTLTADEIQFFVDGLANGNFEDAQIGAFLMASYINGLNRNEKSNLTRAMLYSGETLKFKGRQYVDKHSTGGVGDKASFILGPIAAACGVRVPMIAGRGLGHTGGTVDKIESVKGFKTTLSVKQYQDQLKKIGIVLVGQSQDIAPADKKVYSVRDVTATISSIPLITASIMSKKLAEGANGFVFDVKFGNGAFMQELAEAKKLAKSLAHTGNDFDKSVITMVTDMNQGLGNHYGNSNEIIESIKTLKGEGPQDITDLSVKLAGGMIYLAGKAKNLEEGYKKAENSIANGSAYKKFEQLIQAQGGSLKQIRDYNLFPFAKEETHLYAKSDGYLSSVETKLLGNLLIEFKGGRKKSGEKIDHAVGFYSEVSIGDKVKKGQPLLTIYHHKKQSELAKKVIADNQKKLFGINKTKVKPVKLIREIKEYIV